MTTALTDQRLILALPGPPTDDDRQLLSVVVDAVNAFITRVRPDLVAGAPVPGDVAYAALQLGLRWWDKRGSGLAASFNELGYIPGSVDKDIEMGLQIGRYQRPVAI